VTEQDPSGETKSRRKDQESKVGLCKRKIVGNLLSKAVPDVIKVLDLEEGHGGQCLDPLLIERVIV
jgi:hypothetical protein